MIGHYYDIHENDSLIALSSQKHKGHSLYMIKKNIFCVISVDYNKQKFLNSIIFPYAEIYQGNKPRDQWCKKDQWA